MKNRTLIIIVIAGLIGLLTGGDALALKKNSVRTKHIKKNAVTTSKIRDGSVTDAKIRGPISPSKLDTSTLSCLEGYSIRKINQDGTVECEKDDTVGSSTISTSEIKDGEVKTSDLANGAVTTNKIASGAVTDDKIAGNISPSKIAGGAASLNFSGTQSFDGGTLRIDAANNRVGVNVAPSQALDVSGNAEVTGNYRYANSRMYYHFLSGSDFLAESGSDDKWSRSWRGYGYVKSSGYFGVTAPLHLPQGADIVELRCFYTDNSSSQNWASIKAFLFSRYYTSSSTPNYLAETPLITPGSINSSNVYSFYDSTISGSGDPVNNGAYSYVVQASLNASGVDKSLKFYGCRIAYTLQEVSSP